jgi:ferric-dicitrate binding protein FerR (iron transport regulator)
MSRQFLAILLVAGTAFAAGTRVTFLVGSADVRRSGKAIPVRVPMALQPGDSIKVARESRLEVRYPDNTILRLDENSRLVVTANSGKPEPTLLGGKAWANVTKVGKGGKGFGLRTPTAVAAVRGTVFRMNEADSSANVRLYEGRVDVGRPQKNGQISGPREVSLQQWVHLLHGEEIVCGKGGNWTSRRFDVASDLKDPWVRFNTERDRALGLPVASETPSEDAGEDPWKK